MHHIISLIIRGRRILSWSVSISLIFIACLLIIELVFAEEERKRATGNGAQIPFSYGADTSNAGISAADEQDEDSSSDEDEPFVPPPDLKLPLGIDMVRLLSQFSVSTYFDAFSG